MGSQRIVSKMASSDIFAVSPVNTTDLQSKYAILTAGIKQRYDSLGVVYKGTPQTGGLITSAAGQIATPLQYFYHSDHLGSSSLITDGSGNLVQHLEYVPFGEVFINERNGNWSTPYKFNGKEQDEETGLYYYGARYYDSRTSVWLSMDPKAEEKPWISPYAYCSDNPLNRIDPDGKDDYYVDKKGRVVRVEKNTKSDNFYRVNTKGERMQGKGNSLIFKHGTVQFVHPANEKDYGKRDPKSGTIDRFNVQGDKNASTIYKFVAGSKQSDGTTKQTVEWSKFQLITDGSKYNNVLGTGNDRSREYATPDIMATIKADGDKIRDFTHSHPNTYGDAQPYPSDDDYYWFKEVHKNNPYATDHIYTPDDDQTKPY